MKKHSIAGVDLPIPVFNAAGPWKTKEQIKRLIFSDSGAVMVGSVTLKNKPFLRKRYWSNGEISLNALGLQNSGIGYYEKYLPPLIKLAHKHGKPVFFSIAGYTVEEYAILYRRAAALFVDLVEFNLSCPNVWENGKQKNLWCFDTSSLQKIMRQIEKIDGPPISLKISPFSDPQALTRFSKFVSQNKKIRVVTAINTYPNALILGKNEVPPINTPSGLAGLGGTHLKHIGLGQIAQLRKTLPQEVALIGVGGITSTADVREYIAAGATAVAIGTAFFEQGPTIFRKFLRLK